MVMSVELIAKHIGFTNYRYARLSGGDISSSYVISSPRTKYFIKLNPASTFPGMFEREAEGLKALQENSDFIIPGVIGCGFAGKDQYLVLEWLEQATTNKEIQFEAGQKLARLHLQQQDWFGWSTDNYIGSLPQLNSRHNDWSSFYTENRIMPLARMLANQEKIAKSSIRVAEQFCLRLTDLFPKEPASLLHGDLWSGNFTVTQKGPAIFDPAVYYGHREMDIAMTRLFGGFDELFYQGYEEVYPLEVRWRERLDYSQLYPLLVHAVLFGGNYIERSMKILSGFS
jgi:fructosamine-3-kinase